MLNFLEFCYMQDFAKLQLLPRKQLITEHKTIIIGPPKSGKTSMALYVIQQKNQDKVLYLNLLDFRCDSVVKRSDLQMFINTHQVEWLVIDNFHLGFELPSVKNLIIISENFHDISGFSLVFCKPLVFEEFVLFEKKHPNIIHQFNLFLKSGNHIDTIFLQDFYKMQYAHSLIKLITKDTTEFICLAKIVQNNGQKKSIYQIFLQIKKEFKISKDRFYIYFQTLLDRHIIFSVKKYNQPQSTPKLFVYNHILFEAFSLKKDLNIIFENIIFLELVSLDMPIYYLDGISFYLPLAKTIICAIPFFEHQLLTKYIPYLLDAIDLYEIEKIDIVTLNATQKIYIGSVEANIEPFYEWALGK